MMVWMSKLTRQLEREMVTLEAVEERVHLGSRQIAVEGAEGRGWQVMAKLR